MVSFRDPEFSLGTVVPYFIPKRKEPGLKIFRSIPRYGGKCPLGVWFARAVSVAKKSLHQLALNLLTPSEKIGVQNATSLSWILWHVFCSKFGLITNCHPKICVYSDSKVKGSHPTPPPIQQQPPHPTLTRCSLELAPFFGPKHDEEVTSSQWTSLSLSRAVRANLKRHRGISAVHANCERPWQMSRRISTQENKVPHERSENLNHNSIKFNAA